MAPLEHDVSSRRVSARTFQVCTLVMGRSVCWGLPVPVIAQKGSTDSGQRYCDEGPYATQQLFTRWLGQLRVVTRASCKIALNR